MIRRILFAALATASIPAILGTPAAHAQQARTGVVSLAGTVIAMPHISVSVSGKGSPVVLIPGLSSPREVWDGVLPSLAAKHRVYVVQVNGFGGDDPRDNLKPGILAGIVADLHALVTQQKLGAAPVVGHSMGGLAGLMWAKAYPGDVSRLMVVDSLPYIGDIFVPGATVAQIEPQAAAMRDQMIAGYGKPNQAAADAMAARLALKPESRTTVARWGMAADARVVAQAMYEDMTTDLRQDLATIATPITLVYPWSAQLPKVQAEGFYRAEYAKAPHVSFVDVGDAAHFVMLDQPDAFAAALAVFLN